MNYSKEVILESIESFKSTIRKTQNGLISMSKKGSNTTLINKRLNAFIIGLAILESKDLNFKFEEIIEARDTLSSMLPSIIKLYNKSKEGSPQRTLLVRRIRAFEIVLEIINNTII